MQAYVVDLNLSFILQEPFLQVKICRLKQNRDFSIFCSNCTGESDFYILQHYSMVCITYGKGSFHPALTALT